MVLELLGLHMGNSDAVAKPGAALSFALDEQLFHRCAITLCDVAYRHDPVQHLHKDLLLGAGLKGWDNETGLDQVLDHAAFGLWTAARRQPLA